MEVVLAALTLILLVKMVLTLQQDSKANPNFSSVVKTIQPDMIKKSGYEHLSELKLFGQYTPEPEPTPEIELSALPRTTVSAALTGIVSHPDNNQSMAIIKVGNHQQILKSGDLIANTQATITHIHADRVVLNRNGRNEVLLLRPDEPNRPITTRQKLVSNKRPVPVNTVDTVATINEIINLTPVREGNSLKGYRISSGPLSDAFQRAGFQADDIAIAIDGYDMTTPLQALEVLEELELLEQVSVTVERNGQLHQIQLSI